MAPEIIAFATNYGWRHRQRLTYACARCMGAIGLAEWAAPNGTHYCDWCAGYVVSAEAALSDASRAFALMTGWRAIYRADMNCMRCMQWPSITLWMKGSDGQLCGRCLDAVLNEP